MTLTKRQAEEAETLLAKSMNRPVKRCPSCNAIGSHWVPEGLAEKGHYDCTVPGNVPVIDPTLITVKHAEDILDLMFGRDEQGSIEINGITVDYWADDENVWFYNPGDDGEDTIAKFAVSRSVWRVTS